MNDILSIGPRVTAFPVIHGSGDFAWEVRRLMLRNAYDCLAVALPPSFQDPVEKGILQLPMPSIVLQPESPRFDQGYSADEDSDEFAGLDGELDDERDDDERDDDACDEDDIPSASYVPIDPCQPVIAALRTAMGERLPRYYVDCETAVFEPNTALLPDAYALKKVPLPQWAAGVLPYLKENDNPQWRERMDHMAAQLRELSIDYKNILFVCSVLDWPWIRQAFHQRDLEKIAHDPVETPENYAIEDFSLYFLLGELPFVTGLYERARIDLTSDDNLSIDGIKELLLAGRDRYKEEYRSRAKTVSPQLLKLTLQYVRNLTLVSQRLTPDLITIVTAAKQVIGDGFALEVLEQAKEYPFLNDMPWERLRMGIEQVGFPDGELLNVKSRLPGPPLVWSNLELLPKPDRDDQERWKQRWDPYSQCSWPPEDVLIENFRATVFERARQAMGADLAKTEKFTTSIKDGIDIRDTLRNWHEGEIYVKEIPPNRGNLDATVILFDSPADPRDYPWRTTWFAEHKDESTLAFYATDFAKQPVGPGICLANYGGALFMYPPIAIPDIWANPKLDFAETMEERLLAAACCYSRCQHIALVSSLPPGQAWRTIAKRFKKTWVHLPLGQFSDSTIQQLRMVHVLNGKEVRSYAADFIRRA